MAADRLFTCFITVLGWEKVHIILNISTILLIYILLNFRK